ncbi:MAG TPA: ABC transporter substrate-binding protein [Bauldia sp.]|nr:ABC transporter substrate-binding protein [Bauldia sp.]
MLERFLTTVAALLLAGTALAGTPQRIVSINLCADELLLTLADPGQIAGLSVYATDPTLSFTADAAKAFRHDAASAETVVGLKPDLVLAGRYTKRATRDMLDRLGYRVELLDAAKSIADSEKIIRQVAALVGHPERGQTMIAGIEAARTRAAAAAPSGHPTAAIYQRRGYVTGGDTLSGELLAIAGFQNDGAPLAGNSGGFVPLERIVASPPDYIVVAASTRRAEDQGSALLAHPALAALYPPEKRIVLPEKLTVCGGPSLPAALDWLASEAKRIQQAP